ncbi:hypothetical protein QUF80_07890 [Desulfococcaceae bacterium HSG8]|nr:hypothetical protein [Desulfococcaceae bacterium HSG8]
MKKKLLFEPATEAQIQFIRSLAAGRTHRLYQETHRLSGFNSVNFLSKQEAGHIIDNLKGNTWLRPLPPRTAERIPGDTFSLPHYGHMVGIRKLAAELGWDTDHLKNFIERQFKTSFRKLNREQGQGVFLGLKNILTYPHEKPLSNGLKRQMT